MAALKVWLAILLSVASALPAVSGTATSDLLRVMGPQGINLWKLQQYSRARDQVSGLFIQDTSKFEPGLSDEFAPYYFEQPLDHFSSTSETFGQRYWVSRRHYKPEYPGPVIVLDGGETNGEDRLPFLDTG